MIKVKDRNNLYIPGTEPWRTVFNDKKIKMLEDSWAGVIREHILPSLPVRNISKHFSKTMGRPTKELVTVMGTCVLQQIFDLTDESAREQLAFNEQWHYALDSFSPDDQIISLKTLWNVRHLLLHDKSAKKIFKQSTDKLALAYDVDTRLQRLDSVHIFSNMAQLGRVRLLARVISIFLKNLKRHHRDLYNESSLNDIKGRYEKEDDGAYFGNVKPSGSQKRIQDIALDMHFLIDFFSANQAVTSMYSYLTMQRVFSEHCTVEHKEVKVKPAKEIPSDSIQNPSDLDAAYDGHKGQGYQIQIMETYSRKEDNVEKGKNKLELIMHVETEPAHIHDSKAIKPALDDLDERDLLPEEFSADTLYGSEDNRDISKGYGVDLISPVPGKKPEKDMTGFEFNETTYEIVKCPKGHIPLAIKRNRDSQTAVFSSEQCMSCSKRESCPVKKGKKGFLINYREKEVKTTIHRQYEQSEEFKDKYRYRSGIEATNTRYIHMTGARRLRYRGLIRVDFAATLKALGINIFRTAKFLRNCGISTSDFQEIQLKLAI